MACQSFSARAGPEFMRAVELLVQAHVAEVARLRPDKQQISHAEKVEDAICFRFEPDAHTLQKSDQTGMQCVATDLVDLDSEWVLDHEKQQGSSTQKTSAELLETSTPARSSSVSFEDEDTQRRPPKQCSTKQPGSMDSLAETRGDWENPDILHVSSTECISKEINGTRGSNVSFEYHLDNRDDTELQPIGASTSTQSEDMAATTNPALFVFREYVERNTLAKHVALPDEPGEEKEMCKLRSATGFLDSAMQDGELGTGRSTLCTNRSTAYTNDADAEIPTVRKSGQYGTALKTGVAKIARAHHEGRLGNCVRHLSFESTFASLIAFNTLTIAAESQYRGIDSGRSCSFPGASTSAAESWPGAKETLQVLELIFGILFSLEVILKLMGLQRDFFRSAWNLFDAFIIFFWVLGELVSGSALANPMFFRLCRLARVLRIVRLVKWVQALDSLHVLVASIQSCLSILLWATSLIVVKITLVALVVNHFADSFITDAANPIEKRQLVFLYFGSFTRSAVSLFEVTFGNFAPVMRVMADEVDEWWGLFFVVYKCVGGFAVITVVSGVFMHETFRVANSDADLMVTKNRRQKLAHQKFMQRLFNAADSTGRGTLSYGDFQALMTDPFIVTWLSAYELDVGDVRLLFHLMDDGDGRVTVDEFMRGVSRLKGPARSIDLHTMLRDLDSLKKRVAAMNERVVQIRKHTLQHTNQATLQRLTKGAKEERLASPGAHERSSWQGVYERPSMQNSSEEDTVKL